MKEIKIPIVDLILAISILALVVVGGYWLYNKGKATSVYTGTTPPGAPNSSTTPGQLPKPIVGQ